MKKIILLIGLLTSSFAAQAVPIPWSVNSAPLTGTFTYDADFNIYSAISLQETFFLDSYNSIDSGNALGFTATSQTWGDITSLFFNAPLTNAGGIIGFEGLTECFQLCSEDSHKFEGTVASKGAAVPEPSIIALFAAGLFGIGFVRRRKT